MAHAHRPSGGVQRFSPRRAWDRALGFVDAHDLGQAIGVLIVLGGVGGVIILAAALGAGEPPSAPQPRVAPREVVPTPIPSVNETGEFAFTVPETWDVRSEGRDTQIVSPTGRLVVTFGPRGSGGIEMASARLLESLRETQSNQELIGSTWESIGGSRSLLVSGTAEDSGLSVRFLAITVPSDLRNYAITIVVPASSDPGRILPRLERLVTSFELVDGTPEPAR